MTQTQSPNLFVIGAMKCGTTSLHGYLDLHPEIAMSRRKELNFLSHEDQWARGVEWYRNQFNGTAPVRGESSPAYSSYPLFEHVPERMKDIAPDARIVYLVRDPIERLRSQFRHLLAHRQDRGLSLEEGVAIEHSTLITRSLYAYQLERFLPHFPIERICVVQAERLRSDRLSVLEELFSFLEVDPAFRSPGFERQRHRSERKRRLSDTGARLAALPGLRSLERLSSGPRRRIQGILLRPFTEEVPPVEVPARLMERLQEQFAPDVARLRVLTGQDFEGWSV